MFHRIDNRSILLVPIYQLRYISPRSSQFWVANHDILDLVGNDREFQQNSSWYISSARCGRRNAQSGVATSWWHSSGLREHPIAIGEDVGWIRCQPRDVHKCNRSLLDSHEERILSIALLLLFRITRITLHYPFHESLLSHCHWLGCGRYFAASRHEMLLDEDDSQSSSRIHEHESFLHVSQLHVAYFLALCVQIDGLSTSNKSLRSYLICVYVFVCVFILM